MLLVRLVPTPEIHGSNPVISKLSLCCQLYWKDENKDEEVGNGQFKKLCCRLLENISNSNCVRRP